MDWFKLVSPRKANLSLHLIDLQRHTDALKKLGNRKAGGGFLYINKLGNVDIKILEKNDYCSGEIQYRLLSNG